MSCCGPCGGCCGPCCAPCCAPCCVPCCTPCVYVPYCCTPCCCPCAPCCGPCCGPRKEVEEEIERALIKYIRKPKNIRRRHDYKPDWCLRKNGLQDEDDITKLPIKPYQKAVAVVAKHVYEKRAEGL